MEPHEGGQRYVTMARVILGLERGDPREADHISRDRLDNRRCNLRILTKAQQQQNRRATGKSKHRGVSFVKARAHRKPWRAQGKVDGVQHNIGHFATEQEAADAAREWRRVHQPFSID